MEDLVPTDISHIHEENHTSTFVEREAHSVSENDGAKSKSFSLEDFHTDNVFGKLTIQKGITRGDQIEESGEQQAPSKRGERNKKNCYYFSAQD